MKGEVERLRIVLDKNPHWEGVLELWNKGYTEGKIAKELGVKITLVRSAMQYLATYGFEVITGERRQARREPDSKIAIVPPVNKF